MAYIKHVHHVSLLRLLNKIFNQNWNRRVNKFPNIMISNPRVVTCGQINRTRLIGASLVLFVGNALKINTFFFLYGSTALYGPGPPRFVEVSWSHTLDTPQSVSQRPLPDITQHSQETDIYAPGGSFFLY
jgi:hypothetical protein